MNNRQAVLGVLLIGVGVVFLVGQFGWGPEWTIRRLWPVIPLVFGLSKLIVPSGDGSRRSGLWLVFVGVMFLFHNYRVVTIDDSWPLFIVAMGLSILLGKSDRPAPTRTGS